MEDKDLKDCVIRLEEKLGFMSEKIENIHYILKKGNTKYASKWVEGVMKGAIGTILFGVVGALLGLVIVPGGIAAAYYVITK